MNIELPNIEHEGTEFAPFLVIYRRTDAATAGPKTDEYLARYTDPDEPYASIRATGRSPIAACVHMDDEVEKEIMKFLRGNGSKESEG